MSAQSSLTDGFRERLRRHGCLIASLLALFVVLMIPCALLTAILIAAAPPGGFEIGEDSLSFSADLRQDMFRARFHYQDPAQETLCYRDETITIRFNPLEIQRVPGCQCVVSGPDSRYEVIDCGGQ